MREERMPGAPARLVPELGPSLGRLTEPPLGVPAPGAGGLRLDDIRIDLVTGLFELAGAARSFASAGDTQGAMASLGRAEWLGLWERAVETAARRIAAWVNDRLEDAAAVSRFPPKRLRRLVLRPEDTRAIAARLGAGGAPFVTALDFLEQASRSASGSRASGQDPARWRDALTAAARRLEAAWIALETAAAAEQRRWQVDIERVHDWHRPLWPLWLLTALVLGLAGYVGLVLGGYLPVRPPLKGLAQWWWARW